MHTAKGRAFLLTKRAEAALQVGVHSFAKCIGVLTLGQTILTAPINGPADSSAPQYAPIQGSPPPILPPELSQAGATMPTNLDEQHLNHSRDPVIDPVLQSAHLSSSPRPTVLSTPVRSSPFEVSSSQNVLSGTESSPFSTSSTGNSATSSTFGSSPSSADISNTPCPSKPKESPHYATEKASMRNPIYGKILGARRGTQLHGKI